jgi:O-antigen/teichoic acid export membrane protein
MDLRLARNAIANLLGAAVPALVALATVPLVVRGLGHAGYGLYALVTAIVGYFAVLDINITAGSVKYVAEFNARHERSSVAETVVFGIAVYALLGLAGALALYLGARYFVGQVFGVPAALVEEGVATLRVAALGFFIGQLQNYLQSVPQALMRYDISGRLEMLFGSAVPLATVLVLMQGYGLVEVIALRVAASAVHCLLLWRSVKGLLPELAWRWPGPAIRRSLLRFSAWSFLSRIAALSYAYADKLIIGALAGVTALAYFTVAATLANRVLALSYRLSGVFFPAASALAAGGELVRLERIYLKATRYVVFLNGAILVLVAVFAHPLLRYWMSEEFAAHGALVLALMALSQFVDSLTNLPSLVNDGMGHPRVSGSFAVARAVAGLVLVYLGVAGWGIEGAAWGHLAASLVFTAAFVAWVHGRTVPTPLATLAAHAYGPTLGGLALVALGAALAEHLFDRSGFDFAFILASTVLLLGLQGALFVIERDDRHQAWLRVKAWCGLWRVE